MESVVAQEKPRVFNMLSADGIHFLLRDKISSRYGIESTKEYDKKKKRDIRRLEGVAFLFIPPEAGANLFNLRNLNVTDVIRIWDSNPLRDTETIPGNVPEEGSERSRKSGIAVMREYFSRKTYPNVPSLRPVTYLISDDYPDKEALIELLEEEDPKGRVESF